MNAARTVAVLVPLVLLLAGLHAAAGAAATPRPHILFLLADDLGFADVGYTGSLIKTPVIDRLAGEGQVLGHYYVMHCCSPTRAAPAP